MRFKPFLLGIALGYVYGRITMLWVDIDEYHAIRMDFWKAYNELQEELKQ